MLQLRTTIVEIIVLRRGTEVYASAEGLLANGDIVLETPCEYLLALVLLVRERFSCRWYGDRGQLPGPVRMWLLLTDRHFYTLRVRLKVITATV